MYQPSWKELNWQNILFIGVTHLVTLVGVPYYIMTHGLDVWDVGLLLFFIMASGLGTTVAYHRLFAHRTFQAGNLVTFLGLFFGASAFEMSALEWASQHRDHHRYVDSEKDPYSIQKGFFYAHMGWLLFWKHHFHLSNVEDLKRSYLVSHQHRYYLGWAITAGILTPLFMGLITGHLTGAIILWISARVTFVYQGTFCINSVCHWFGKATYDIFASAKDYWFIALFTWGEGYHNFHHRFPNDYRNGFKWYHWDPSKWTILVLRALHLISELKWTTRFQILQAKLAADQLRIDSNIESIKQKYEHMISLLHQWENQFKNYKKLKTESLLSKAHARLTYFNMQKAKIDFFHSRREWRYLVSCYMRGIEVLPSAISM